MQISVECATKLAELCEHHYQSLITGGCIEDVAADRVWDALNCALEKPDTHCFDPCDRLFENKVRTVAQRGLTNGT